jgi:hypothetical protein
MMPDATWLATIAGATVLGASFGFSRPLTWLSVPGRLAVSAGAGWFLASVTMTAGSILGIRWNEWWIAAVAALAAFGLARGLAQGRPIAAARPRPSAVRAVALTLSWFAVAICVLAVVAGAATSVDLILFWGPKGQAFGAARGFDAAFLRNPDLRYLHASYPPLVPSVYALATMVTGRFSWIGATATFPLILAALAAALPSVLRLSTTADRAAATSAVIVCGIALLGNEADIAGNGEMPLLFFETLAAAVLIAPAATAPSMQLLAGMLLGGAVSTKVEGLPFAVALAAVFLAARRRQLVLWSAATRLTVPTALALGLWFLFGALASSGRARDQRVGNRLAPLADRLRVAVRSGGGAPRGSARRGASRARTSRSGGAPGRIPALHLSPPAGSVRMDLLVRGASVLAAHPDAVARRRRSFAALRGIAASESRGGGRQRPSGLIRRGQQDGSFRPEFSDVAVTAAAMGAVEGMLRERLVSERAARRPFAEREIRRVFAALLTGVAARPVELTGRDTR